MKNIFGLVFKQRFVTAVIFVAVMLGGVYCGPIGFFLLFGLIVAASIRELMKMLQDPEDQFPLIRITGGILLGLMPYLWLNKAGFVQIPFGETAPDKFVFVAVYVIGVLFLLMILELFLAARQPFANLGHYLMALFYISVPYTLLSYIAFPGNQYAPNRVFGLLWLVWTNDTVAYLIGSWIGKTKLFERISPKKSWEGTLAGAAGSILMAWILSYYVPDFSRLQWMWMGIVVSVFGPAGDLVESMVKRSESVKDSGDLLPGHGGLLDRFDAFMFILPFAWIVLELLSGK